MDDPIASLRLMETLLKACQTLLATHPDRELAAQVGTQVNIVAEELRLRSSTTLVPPQGPTPTQTPVSVPTQSLSPMPTKGPSPVPTKGPSPAPTQGPSPAPTQGPTPAPTQGPSSMPTQAPSPAPSRDPRLKPSQAPPTDPTPMVSPSEDMEAESASAYSSSSDDSSDHFTEVKRKRKKSTIATTSAPAAKKATKALSASPPSSAPSSAPSSRPPSPTGPSPQVVDRSPSPMDTAAAAPKSRSPPPLFIHDKGKWTEVSAACNERQIRYTNARAVQLGIKVTVPTARDYRELHKLLTTRKIPFHSFALPEARQTRVVVKNVPREIPTADILSDLESQNIPVAEVHRMHRRGGDAYDMVLIVCDPTEGHHPIFQISKICGLSGLSIEKPRQSGIVGQCHRCQLYGHSQRNCFGKPRCVKCLGDHGTPDCPRPKDRSQCVEPPSCVLCGETGHPANYRGCPKAPKSSSPKLAKRANARQSRECPTLSGTLPTSLSPQRPSPWNALNHQAHFPALKPSAPAPVSQTTQAPKAAPTTQSVKAIPALMDVAVPPFSPPITTRTTAPAQVAPPSPPPPAPACGGGEEDDLSQNIALITYDAFHSPRAKAMTEALKNCRGNHHAVFRDFRDVAHYIQIYRSYYG